MAVLGATAVGAVSDGRWWPSRCRLAALLFPLFLGRVLGAEPPAFRDPQIKAVFLYNFTQFVRWPSNAFPNDRTPFVIGVLGDDPFQGYLQAAVQNETVDRHPLVVHQFRHAEDASACQLLFVSAAMADELPQILGLLRNRSVLTVAEIPGFCSQGGMIQLEIRNRKPRLRINLDAATDAHLWISSKLLRPAEIVRATRN